MKYIPIILLFASCTTTKPATVTPAVEVRWDVPNLNRTFGSAPTEWKLAIKLLDGTVLLLTEKEVKMYIDRWGKNKEDWR